MARRLFALDQNFPEPIVAALNLYIVEAELVPVRHIDPLLSEMDDWQLFVSLQSRSKWDGLITTNSKMLRVPREVAAVRQTNLTLVVAQDAGNDPIKATGLLFTHLGWICQQTSPKRAQIWSLTANNRPGLDPWDFIERIAKHTHRSPDEVSNEGALTSYSSRRVRWRRRPVVVTVVTLAVRSGSVAAARVVRKPVVVRVERT